jgi:hypothetical protein
MALFSGFQQHYIGFVYQFVAGVGARISVWSVEISSRCFVVRFGLSDGHIAGLL